MQADLNWLTDPAVFRVNRLDAHADHVCYASVEELAAGNTSLRQPLDGIWRFHWSRCPAERPADFWREDFDDRSFGTIQVPGHMELQGFGQIQYTNVLYPWDGHAALRPPEIDWTDAPVGSYRTTFDLAPGLRGKRVCISFQGAEQALFVWLNGHFVGYAEDSFTPSEFDLSPWIRETGNLLCAEVHKRSSAGWLEDQDFFRFSGLFRSVYLYAKPAVHAEDLWLKTDWDGESSTGLLRVRLKIDGDGASVSLRLTAPDGAVLRDGPLSLTERDGFWYSEEERFPGVRPWCHADPVLYDALLTLYDRDGTLTEVVPYRTGFRHFGIQDGVMCLNGERLVIRGINRHEWNPRRGRAVLKEDMDRAMDTFCRNHINAVRTCHYPNQTLWYHLCDENGIYMMDETNMESHGSWQKPGFEDPTWNVPGSRPEWRECVLDRAVSMFERDKNHPSILFWSCGNESYAGEDILAMADWFRAQDSGRLVHYEGVFHNRAFDRISDVESRMYAPPEDIRAYLENQPKKPFLLCEYMHDMGNSLGGMESYIRLTEQYPLCQGGFIWDYMDQALWHTLPDGREVLGYGGDFGDRPTDYAFSGNGIVFADGTEKPAMQEVRYWYASPSERAEQDRRNREAAEKPIPPLGSRSPAPLRVVRGDGGLGVRGDGFEVLFSLPYGGPVSLRTGGQEWLWRAPRPAFWRAPTENDMGCGFDKRAALWSAVETGLVCSDMRILRVDPEECAVRYTYTAPVLPGLNAEVVYTLDPSGGLGVEARYDGAAGRPELPLFGLRFATPAPVDTVEWTGLSGETYPDRMKGGVYGNHASAPEIPDYLVPQECGCHMDTRRAVLRMGDGALCLNAADRPFAFSAVPYTPCQLEQAAHKYELPVPCRTVVTVCGAMRGVGGIDSWGSDVEPPYRVPSDRDLTCSFRFCL